MPAYWQTEFPAMRIFPQASPSGENLVFAAFISSAAPTAPVRTVMICSAPIRATAIRSSSIRALMYLTRSVPIYSAIAAPKAASAITPAVVTAHAYSDTSVTAACSQISASPRASCQSKQTRHCYEIDLCFHDQILP
jgi:hypothetical protein